MLLLVTLKAMSCITNMYNYTKYVATYGYMNVLLKTKTKLGDSFISTFYSKRIQTDMHR